MPTLAGSLLCASWYRGKKKCSLVTIVQTVAAKLERCQEECPRPRPVQPVPKSCPLNRAHCKTLKLLQNGMNSNAPAKTRPLEGGILSASRGHVQCTARAIPSTKCTPSVLNGN